MEAERRGGLGSCLLSPRPFSPALPLTSLAVGCPFLHVKGPVPNGCLAGRAGETMHMPGHLQGMHDFLGGGNSYLAAQSPPSSPEQGIHGGGPWALFLPMVMLCPHTHPPYFHPRSLRDVHHASNLPCPKLSSQSAHSKPDPPTAVPVYFWQLHPSICTGQIPFSHTPISSTRKSF